MNGYKLKLARQVRIMADFLDENLEQVTEKQAEEALQQISWVWSKIDRRKVGEPRNGRHTSHA